MQSLVLAAFFLPYILPVTVVYRTWGWMLDQEFGIAQYVIAPLTRPACGGVPDGSAGHAGSRLHHGLVDLGFNCSCSSPA